MWLEVINEVSEKGTGLKLVLRALLMLCYLDEKVILFKDTEFLFIYFLSKFRYPYQPSLVRDYQPPLRPSQSRSSR